MSHLLHHRFVLYDYEKPPARFFVRENSTGDLCVRLYRDLSIEESIERGIEPEIVEMMKSNPCLRKRIVTRSLTSKEFDSISPYADAPIYFLKPQSDLEWEKCQGAT